MKTITAPNGKQYEVDEGWREMSELQGDIRINVLHPDGSCEPESGYTMRTGTYSGSPIAWRPIVPPQFKKERRYVVVSTGSRWCINEMPENTAVACCIPTREAAQAIADIYEGGKP